MLTQSDEQAVAGSKRKLMEYKRVRTNLETTQNLLDSFDSKKASQAKRSQSKVQINALMQPILKQAKTRPLSIVDSGSDLIFMDKPRSGPFSPISMNLGRSNSFLIKDHSKISAKTSQHVVTSGSKQMRNNRR